MREDFTGGFMQKSCITPTEQRPALNAYDYETILHYRHTVKEKRIV